MKATPAILTLAGLLTLGLCARLWQSKSEEAAHAARNQEAAKAAEIRAEKYYADLTARENAAKEERRRELDEQIVTWLTDAKAALRASPRDQPGRILNLQTSIKTAYDSAKEADIISKLGRLQSALGYIADAEGLRRFIDHLEAQALLKAP